MSATGTEQSTTLNISGCWRAQAETNKPPLLPPPIANLLGFVYFSSTRYEAALMKSSNTFCLLPSIPPLCQSSPYSFPPLIPGNAMIPPSSSQDSLDKEK